MFFKKEDTALDRLLEEKFTNPEELEIDGEKIKIIDLQPLKLKTKIPVAVVPGWSATAKVLKENIIGLAKTGRRVIAVSAPHGIKTRRNKKYPLPELRKTAALLYTLDYKNLKKVDAVSHSEAAIFLTIAVKENPKKFRNLILVSPAGLIGRDNLFRLIERFLLNIAKQCARAIFLEPHRLKKISLSFSEGVKAIFTEPRKTIREVKAIIRFKISDLLFELNKKHGVCVIVGADDLLFPIAKIKEQLKEGIIDQFVVVPGSHNELYLGPENFTKLIDELLDKMAKNKND